MRPFAPSFEPSRLAATMGTSKDHEYETEWLNESLLKALVKEKEGHCAAKVALETAHAQITSLLDENKTLRASKTLLEAIVKNNKTQHPGLPVRELPANIPIAEEVKASFAKGSTINTVDKSILYDDLVKQRETYETKGYPEEQLATGLDSTSTSQKQESGYIAHNLQDNKSFDISVVSPTTQEVSEFSVRERRTFRNFLHEVDAVVNMPKASPPTPEDRAENKQTFLIEVTPPTKKLPVKPTVAEAIESCQKALKSVVKMDQAKRNLEKPPTLHLPADFLAKYQPTRKAPVTEPKIENPFSAGAQGLQEVNIRTTEPVQDDIMAANDAPPSGFRRIAREDLKSVMQEIVKTKPDTQTAALPVLDTEIKWAMSSLFPAFDDDEKKRRVQNFSNTKEGSYFWQHTVRFLPNPTEKNLYRTVMIDYIPHGTTYQDVLEHVRTGSLESIQLFPPLRGSTYFFTARVVFTYELPAVSMVMQYQKRVSQGDPIKIKGSPVRFWQVLQPTYPANKQLETDIFQHGYTRILLLENVEDSGLLPKLHLKLAPELQNGTVIRIFRTADGVPMIEFTSVAAAAAVMRRFEGDREFKGCTFDFDRDYCEDGYESE